MSGSHIDEKGNHEVRRNVARTLVEQAGMLAFDDVEAANPAADIDATPLPVKACQVEPAVGQRLIGRRHSVLDVRRRALDLTGVKELPWVEVLDLCGKANVITTGIKARNGTGAGAPGQKRLPVFLAGVADGRDQPDAGHHHTSFLGKSPWFRKACAIRESCPHSQWGQVKGFRRQADAPASVAGD